LRWPALRSAQHTRKVQAEPAVGELVAAQVEQAQGLELEPVLAPESEVQGQAPGLELAWAPDLQELEAQGALASAAQLVRAERERAAPDRAAPREGPKRELSTPADVMIPPADSLAHV
jgi:hypothetical protein